MRETLISVGISWLPGTPFPNLYRPTQLLKFSHPTRTSPQTLNQLCLSSTTGLSQTSRLLLQQRQVLWPSSSKLRRLLVQLQFPRGSHLSSMIATSHKRNDYRWCSILASQWTHYFRLPRYRESVWRKNRAFLSQQPMKFSNCYIPIQVGGDAPYSLSETALRSALQVPSTFWSLDIRNFILTSRFGSPLILDYLPWLT